MNLAIFLTLIRVLLVPALIIAITYNSPAALSIFVLGCLTDALDGYVARTFNQKTEFGTFLDPLADKLLLISAFLSIYFHSGFAIRPPTWVITLIASRDVLIIMGLVILFFTTGKINVVPNLLGKVTTFFQMLTVVFLFLQNKWSPVLWNVTAFLTIISGSAYIIREARRLHEVPVS